jgi:hypothetical protein
MQQNAILSCHIHLGDSYIMSKEITITLSTLGLLGLVANTGCFSGCGTSRPVTMAPPMPQQPAIIQQAPGQMGGGMGQAGNMGGGTIANNGADNSVYNWRDVPAGQNVPVQTAKFDQGGYQIYAQSGETIVVPFENQNMYVMKFGRSTSGGMYFINDGTAPTLYVPTGVGLENMAASGARWYPFSQNFAYERPVYIGIAPTWSDYMAMHWYSGMLFHGGYYGYRPWYPGFAYSPMVGLNVFIGGSRYTGWNSYRGYYGSHPGAMWSSRPSYNYTSVRRQSPSSTTFARRSGGSGSFSASRPGSSGSFGTRPNFGSGRTTGTGSFGSSGRATGTSGGFSSSGTRPSGSFGSGTGTRPAFGSGSSGVSRPSGSFGSSGNSGFGRTTTRPGGSFGSSGTSSGFGRSSGGFGSSSGSGFRPGGGGFSSGSSSSSGGFSSGRSSGGFGGGSFGRSSGGFGGRRR